MKIALNFDERLIKNITKENVLVALVGYQTTKQMSPQSCKMALRASFLAFEKSN
jgi:hypothetical protein